MPFTVVLNGCDITPKPVDLDVRERLKISPETFLFVFVGNINKNKNQVQVVDAMRLFSEAKRARIGVVFVGGGDVEYLNQYIANNGLSSSMWAMGAVPKWEVHNYYAAANASVLTSLSEGFGLSIIEGYIYGLPTVTFRDLGAYEDICTDTTSIGVPERSDSALAKGMEECMSRSWDHKEIRRFGQMFGNEAMRDRYLALYEQIIRK